MFAEIRSVLSELWTGEGISLSPTEEGATWWVALESIFPELYYPLWVPKKGGKLSAGGVRFGTQHLTADA